MKTNIKLRVTPEQSEAVQKICFANGIKWKQTNFNRYTKDVKYIFISPTNLTKCLPDCYFEAHPYTEVDADLFIQTNGTCEESIDIVDNLSNNKSKEDMFKQYGFEVPDFDCTILTKVKDEYVGYIITDNDAVIALSWSLSGTGYIGTTYDPEYNLTPIKQPWYETCKFPVLLIKLDGLHHETYGLASHCNHPDELCVNNAYEHIRDWRPLSNKEIDQLKQDF